jgi:hypothetical protein
MPKLACRLVEMEYRESKRSSMADRATRRPLRPGDMFYHHRVLERFPAWLAPNYRWQNAHRPPVAVILPDTTLFLVDGLPYNNGLGYYGNGYNVRGEPPCLTITEPITDHPSGWTGWLRDGVLEWE